MNLKCIVVTPERTILEKPATLVSFPLYDGEMAVAVNHAPLIGRLGSGELRIKNGEAAESYYISRGFVEVLDNTVTFLTARAVPAANITPESAESAYADAEKKPATTLAETELRDTAMTEARAMRRMAKKTRA